MFKGKIDIKVLFILVLAGALIFNFIFNDSTNIDEYKEKIKVLQNENSKLLNNKDSLELVNFKLNKVNDSLMFTVDSTKLKIAQKDNQIKDLQNAKDKVSDIISNLNADGVASTLSEYLSRKE
tara:strand:+ start:3338 stop:3706 length:369 start_codon:yes stop_codon:yes gene_type:complete